MISPTSSSQKRLDPPPILMNISHDPSSRKKQLSHHAEEHPLWGRVIENWQQNVALAGVVIAVIAVAVAFFCGLFVPTVIYSLLGVICLISYCHLRDYPYLLGLNEAVPQLQTENQRLHDTNIEIERNVESLKETDELFKARYEAFLEVSAAHNLETLQLKAVREDLEKTTTNLSTVKEQINTEVARLEIARKQIEQSTLALAVTVTHKQRVLPQPK